MYSLDDPQSGETVILHRSRNLHEIAGIKQALDTAGIAFILRNENFMMQTCYSQAQFMVTQADASNAKAILQTLLRAR